ncbi:hypothetical protein [Ureibacillus sp. GCM10028918]|uniref:hypothetical protein n=1 Tax=Ureibacillus sp. GCM10028918 TaxID=3273429 RepID=UPI0036086308
MDQFEKRSIYWVFAILVIVIAPIIVLLTPVVLSVVVFEDPNKIAFISFGKNLIMYLLAFFITFISLVFLYFVKKFITKLYVIILSLFGFFTIYLTGLNYYVYLDENYIEYNPLLGSKVVYQWAELTNVRHLYPDSETGEDEKYIFHFSDGYSFQFEPTGAMDSSVKSKLYNKLQLFKVPIEEY